jgi:hypothetical protein
MASPFKKITSSAIQNLKYGNLHCRRDLTYTVVKADYQWNIVMFFTTSYPLAW